MGVLLNANLNETDISINLLSKIIQKVESESSLYNISTVLQYNISELLETIQLQLDTANWLMLQVENKQGILNSTLDTYAINTIAQWMIDNYQHINLIIKDSEFMTNSFNNVFNLTDLIYIFNVTVQNEQIQGLMHQIAAETFTKVSLIGNLLMDENIDNDFEAVVLLLHEINSINISLILSSISQVCQTLQGIGGLALDHPHYNNITAGQVFQIIKEGMEILYEIQGKGTIGKEAIYQIYNFTYLLVQGEWKWVPFQNISAMEAELLDVFYLAMTPFLGGNGSQAYTGNCSAQDVLQILLQTIFRNATVNESVVKATCNWQLVNNSSDSSSNHTLDDMIYLALQSSPMFHNVCNKDNLHPLAEEMTCLMQAMGISMGVLAHLNNLSGLQIPLIQSLNQSLAFIYNNMLNHSFTFQSETQLLQIVDGIFLNQSDPVHLFIQFLIKHYNSTVQTSDLQQTWTEISKIIKVLAPLNGSFDNHVYELIEAAINLTVQASWFESWQTLDNVLSMNRTSVKIDLSLSVLDTLRRAVVLINSGLDAKTLQIYQAIVSLFKNPNLAVLFDPTNPPLMNTTLSSVEECTAVLNAVAKFSDSLWAAFDPTNSNINEALLSNVSLLACEVLYFQSGNYTRISNLETIKHILPSLVPYIPTEITPYFTALEKIISFLFDVPLSQNISQENIMGGVYELFIQELKVFNNATVITGWIERIPVQNFISILSDLINNVTAEQVIILESRPLFLLSGIFNATSYLEGFSMLSDLITYLPDISSNLTTVTGIKQQFMNLSTEFNVTVQISPLTEPYRTIMNCVGNVTQDVFNYLPGHLEVAMQLAQDLFTQSNKSQNASMSPDVLQQKIYQLQILTTVVCGLESSTNSQSQCYLPCQYLTLLQEVANIVTTAIKVAQTATNINSPVIITSFLDGIWQSIENELSAKLSSYLQVNDLANVTKVLSSFINGTSEDFQAILGNVFYNKSHVAEQLSEVVKLNQTSITALMRVPIPNNITQFVTWFTTLNQCSTNNSLVIAPLQVFCNLPPEQGYQMTLIFLQNTDVLKLVYRLVVPPTWQTNFDSILSALKILIEKLYNLFEILPSEQDMNNLMKIINPIMDFISIPTRRRRSVDLSAFQESTRATNNSFTKILYFLCNNNYVDFIRVLLSLSSSSLNRDSERAQNLSQLYAIPTDNPFCLNLFSNLVTTSSGAGKWLLLKPILYGKILYTPNTYETQMIMEETSSSLSQVESYKTTLNNVPTVMEKIQTYLPLLNDLLNDGTDFLGTIKGILNNTVVSGILWDFLQVNSTDLSEKLGLIDPFIQEMKKIKNIGNSETALISEICKVLLQLLSCMATNRIEPMNSTAEMTAKAEQLQQTNELFAAVTFDLPSGTSRRKRSVSKTSGLPKQIKYSIGMRSLLSENTYNIRDANWIPGPHTSVNKYSRGFVYLQENIERSIIKMQTNKTLVDVAVQYQPTPFPCYKSDNFLASMSFALPIALMITWVLFIAAFVKKLVHEKELRLHEYMKMMGVNSCSHFFAWLIESACFLILSSSILVLILKFGKLLPLTNGFILFIFFLDYSLTVIAMSYLISVFFHNTNVAALSGSLIYIISFFPFIVVVTKESSLSFAAKTLLSIFSPTALSYATQYIVRFEEQDEGIQWHNMYDSPTLNDTFSFGWLCWMMLIDAMIYFVIGWYIRIVFPGKYGIGSVWYFPVLPSFWLECCGFQSLCSRKPSGLIMSNIVSHGIPAKKGGDLYPHNEQEPTDLNVGVSLHGLTKAFKDKLAVQNLNLNFYEGHITSLLGHNGAGKTTTLSMLMGLFSATSGTIYVYGEDIRTRLDQARKSMGVCMQYDALFDHLTTKEHLLLYGSIKAPQWNKRQLHSEVKRTLKETGLYSHRHKPVMTLSGGMKRKLSICIALIGGSKVVILDEPTTGVDPCSRRSIWEVISKNKNDKTIILSTHHLDEAEVLSDRIAFLEQGGLRCSGTPMFLKEKFGSGYRLTLTKKFPNQKDYKLCDSDKVTTLIHAHIPEAKLKEDVGGELVYVLPPFSAEISNTYLSLLRDLDTNMNDLHIGCYGISDTTIEEVFLKLIDGLDEGHQELPNTDLPVHNQDHLAVDDSPASNLYTFSNREDQPLTEMENLKGGKLMLKRIMAIWIKRFHNTKRNWKSLISQILLPVCFVIAAMGLGSLSMTSVEYPELLLSPNLYGTTDQAVVFGSYNESSEDLMNAMSSFPGIDNSCLDQNSQCLPESSLGSWTIAGNQTLINGGCNCSTGFQVCVAPGESPPHRKTYSGQMMYNVTPDDMEQYLLATTLQFVQQRYGGWSFGIPVSQISTLIPVSPNMTLNKVWYNNEGRHSLPAFLNSFNNFLLRSNLPSNESAQYSISVSNKPLPGAVTLPNISNTMVNMLVALSVLVGYSITTSSFATYIVKEYDNGSKRLQHIAGVGEVCYWVTNFLYDLAFYLIPVALSIAMIAVFKLPAFYNYPNLAGVSLLFILFGYATFTWMYLIAGAFKNAGMAFITYVCINLLIGINTIISSSVVYMLLQNYNETSDGYKRLNSTYNVLVNLFKIFPQFCFGYGLIQLSQQQAIHDQLAIYGTDTKVDVFSMDILGYMFVAMFVQGTFCFILRLLINDGIIYSIKSFIKKTCMKNPRLIVKDPEEDEDVVAERERVETDKVDEDLLLLKGLTKIFHQVNKNAIAVNNMSLGIPAGECFGLLGVNGAGKTTTFKMLTGDISPSGGKIQLRNHTGELVNVLGFNADWSSFGYCPQEDALDELMTGEEHLYYYARIHGIPEKWIKSVSNQLLQKLELVQYKDKITANYSCGTRRKLSTALALIGKPSILLLDEPSSGMDPKTKRHLWKIITEEVQNKCSVVLTSHSMEECEALCTRLAIMVKGKFQCIGSLQHIKNRFGSGFTVKMHIKDSSVNVETITDFMQLHFPNTYLKEQHFTMVEYHVPMSAGGVASIFELLESNKITLNIIHFSVSQTTLDEVFINFAQSQSSSDNSSTSGQEFQQVVVA
ncbi:glucosylceramide transporter ABCA12 [Mixophyes fleayi]|uniref:glucosylceramide transporter ABCA12 n=1 Tax=Mixophyes fleayi TaxID=3061075 RepID=UPI003F4DF054